MKKLNICVVGASGYTGMELIRILLNHPYINIKNLVAESNAGNHMHDIYGHFSTQELPVLQKFDEVDFNTIDIAFCCLPHGTSQQLISDIASKTIVIDLSADFRLNNLESYEKWYNLRHIASDLQQKAAYGLSEVYFKQIEQSNLIACPGCYPTSILLPLMPLFYKDLIETNNIIIDSKSGTSGAGRSAKQSTFFCEINENFKAYSIKGHRHKAEIVEKLSDISSDANLSFVPHLVPMDRGIFSTIYVKLKNNGIEYLQQNLSDFYQDAPFVQICELGKFISTKDVRGTNLCKISLHQGQLDGYVTITSVIDNLVKGASGQAVQNMNIRFGFEETLGLEARTLFP